MPENLADLIQRCLDGNEHACAALFDQYKGLVYRTAYLMLSHAHDAEDTLQDVFVQVFRSLDRYDASRAAFSTWLHRITVNACLGRLRRVKLLESLAWDEQVEQTSADASDSLLARLSQLEQAQRLLEALDADQRAVVILRFYWDVPYQEIAEILGTPLGTVQSRLGRALRKMRTVTEQWEAEDR